MGCNDFALSPSSATAAAHGLRHRSRTHTKGRLGSEPDIGGVGEQRPLPSANQTYIARLPNLTICMSAYEQEADPTARRALCLLIAISRHSEESLCA